MPQRYFEESELFNMSLREVLKSINDTPDLLLRAKKFSILIVFVLNLPELPEALRQGIVRDVLFSRKIELMQKLKGQG